MGGWVVQRGKRILRDIASFHGEPAQIARGAALGTFIAFTPTLGVQLILAVFVATALRANRALALAFVWITNAFTALPIYMFCYEVGKALVGGPGVAETGTRLRHVFRMADKHGSWEIFDRMREGLALGGEVLWPMTVGGVIVGTACSVPVYFATLWLVKLGRHVWQHHHHHATPDNNAPVTPSRSSEAQS